MADALGSGTGNTFSAEGDLELVGEALPFGLKTMEALAAEVPENKGLFLSLAQGFSLYAYAFAELEGEKVKEDDFKAYQRQTQRAGKFYYRAHEYAVKGLAAASEEFGENKGKDLTAAVNAVEEKEDAALLYWAGASLAKWITVSRNNPSAISRLPETVVYINRVLDLDSAFDKGSAYEFLMSYECRGAAMGGDTSRAKEHYRRALELSGGKKMSVFLSYAELFSIPSQNREEFRELIKKVIAYDLDEYPAGRLTNAIARKKAEILLSREEDLFFE